MSTPIHLRRTGFDPAPELRELAGEPGMPLIMSQFGPARLAVRHADVRAVLSDTTAFSNKAERRLNLEEARAGGDESFEDAPGFLLGLDPPEHTVLRRMLTPEFTVRRMKRVEPRVHEIVTDLLDAVEKSGPPAELVADFALPVPSLVICELLGVPYEDAGWFQSRSTGQLDLALTLDERARNGRELGEYIGELVDRQRADPGDNLIGMLLREHEVSREEVIGVASLLLIAGHETTANMLSLGTLILLRNPDQLALLRDDPSAVDAAIEELLRYLTVAHSTIARDVLVDVKVGDQQLHAGEVVLCSLTLANRELSDTFDITRAPSPHAAFGHGAHHCLGAPLARMELRIAFPALLRRFPGLRLAVPDGEIVFADNTPVHGIKTLPVTW
ncbi:cytochrome P450 [Amycolatopsis sp. NPDC059657]|uniref:cytochrome P450 n=1 Tax=Amycolatopsis sp. NPDC059657 TaxID=3346899 RepID=UPI0036731FF2